MHIIEEETRIEFHSRSCLDRILKENGMFDWAAHNNCDIKSVHMGRNKHFPLFCR